MVRTFLKVYMELGSYFLFLQEQIKDIIIIKGTADSWGHGQMQAMHAHLVQRWSSLCVRFVSSQSR
jgi:hypothetical protein